MDRVWHEHPNSYEGKLFHFIIKDGTAGTSVYDLIEPWVEPVKHECFVNVYDSGFGRNYWSYNEATENVGMSATIKITYIDGKVEAEIVK